MQLDKTIKNTKSL